MFDNLKGYAALPLRLILGFGMIYHGWPKTGGKTLYRNPRRRNRPQTPRTSPIGERYVDAVPNVSSAPSPGSFKRLRAVS